MKAVCLVLLAACSGEGSHPGTGTVGYIGAGGADVHVHDLATDEDTIVERGRFGAVAVAPDGEHVAYATLDRGIHVADRSGAITEIPFDGTSCRPVPAWYAAGALAWSRCEPGTTMSTLGFVPAIGAAPRMLDARSLLVADDGARIAYGRPAGDLVIEAPDGSQQVVAAITATPIAFTADGQHVVASTIGDLVRISVADGTYEHLGVRYASSSRSPDGTELLVFGPNGFGGLDLATGAVRDVAHGDSGVLEPELLDRDRVVYAHTSGNGDDVIGKESIKIADAGGVTTLVPEADFGLSCRLRGVARSQFFIATTCPDALLVDFDGTVLSSLPTSPMGVTGDDAGVVALDASGAIAFVGKSGAETPLAQSMSPVSPDADVALQPFAAYAP